jgi:hypothetical protein
VLRRGLAGNVGSFANRRTYLTPDFAPADAFPTPWSSRGPAPSVRPSAVSLSSRRFTDQSGGAGDTGSVRSSGGQQILTPGPLTSASLFLHEVS